MRCSAAYVPPHVNHMNRLPTVLQVRDEFNRLLSEEELRDAFCLVIASKQASLSLAHMHVFVQTELAPV